MSECSCYPPLRIQCSHFGGWVVYLGHNRFVNNPVAGYVVSGGPDIDDPAVAPDWVLKFDDEAAATAAYAEAEEGLRTLYDDQANR